jgi:hypothetical protein
VSSGTNTAGDAVLAKLLSDVTAGDKVLLAAGSVVRGRVTAAVSSGRVKGRARLALSFDRVLVKGREHALLTRELDITAEDSHKRDAAIVGGGAGAGGGIGAIAGGKKGAGKGVLIGGRAPAPCRHEGQEVTCRGAQIEIAGARSPGLTSGWKRGQITHCHTGSISRSDPRRREEVPWAS